MRKIVFHLNCLEQGGAERVVTTLANRLVQEGYDVYIATEWTAENEFAIDEKIMRLMNWDYPHRRHETFIHVNAAAPVNAAVQPKNAAPKKQLPVKTLIIAAAAAVAFIIAIVVIAIVAINAGKTINLDKYLTIEASGYDGYGNAKVTIDWDAIVAIDLPPLNSQNSTHGT